MILTEFQSNRKRRTKQSAVYTTETEDYYMAYDARNEILHATDHWKICRWLDVGFDHVTAEDVERASRSDDVPTQAVRLRPVFEMCGLVGDEHEADRVDLIRRLADAGPQSDPEMRILFQAIAAEYMAARCASDAMSPGQSMEVMSMQLGNFSKLARLGNELREGQQRIRQAQKPSLKLLDASNQAAIGQTKMLTAGKEGFEREGDESPLHLGSERD